MNIDWNDERIPEWAVAVAMDADRTAWAHSGRPEMWGNAWVGSTTVCFLPHLNGFADDWTKSLVMRPGAEDHDSVEPGPNDWTTHNSDHLPAGRVGEIAGTPEAHGFEPPYSEDLEKLGREMAGYEAPGVVRIRRRQQREGRRNRRPGG